jgi:hypothetical protein
MMKAMRRLAVLLTFLAAAALGACGGGSSTPTDGPGTKGPTGPGPDATVEYILVEVEDEEDLEELAEETGATVIGPVPGTSYWRIQMPAGMSMAEFQREMDDDVRVLNADLEVSMSSPEGDGSTLPAGGLLIASFVPVQGELLRIGVEVGRARAAGRGVRVAVLDTGIVEHDFVDGNIEATGWDFVDEDADPRDERNGLDDDGDGLMDEGYGHGTFVASLIIAVAPEVRIVPYRVLDSDSTGHASTMATAITMAAERGADVINLSAGMPDRIKVIQDAVQAARARGVMVIASAGNTGTDDVNFPSAISNAFSVTAVDAADLLASFASYGTEVDLSAPGVELLGAFPYDVFPEGTATWSGTSFSAALVSGGFALLRELFPGMSGDDLLDHLVDTAVATEGLNPQIGNRMGEGRLDLGTATEAP